MKQWFWKGVRWFLPSIARVHWKNWPQYITWISERCEEGGDPVRETCDPYWDWSHWRYPQLWYCWPRITHWRRSPRLYALRTTMCRCFTGHEVSETEWGYGGGEMVDRHCRWCDLLIRFPKGEEFVPGPLREVARELGFHGEPI